MSTMNGFSSWEDVSNYVQNTLGIKYTEDPTGWAEAMQELTEGYKYVKCVDDATNTYTYEYLNEDMVSGVGEIHTVPGNGEAWHTGGSSTGSGGAKSVPTAKTIITQQSGSSSTAVVTEEAIGVKDTGIIAKVTPIGVMTGLLQVYGLVQTGIEIANAQVWKDMSNYVYDTEFTEDTPVERVIDFLGMKLTNCIVDRFSDGDVCVNIPEVVAQRMYDFLANHMIQSQTPGIYPDDSFYTTLSYIYDFINRTLELANPSFYTLARYVSVNNPLTETIAEPMEITDDLIKAFVSDALTQFIGGGFLIAASVGTALLASIDGICSFLEAQSVGEFNDDEFLSVKVVLYRGSTPPPKTTPVSLSEFRIRITASQNPNIKRDVDSGYPCFNFNIGAGAADYETPGPALASGYSYQAGDDVKYLKRGKEGTSDSDYGYYMRAVGYNSGQSGKYHTVQLLYPANEQTKTYSTGTISYLDYLYTTFPINGYSCKETTYAGRHDIYVTSDDSLADFGVCFGYSNFGYKGYGSSYMPDDYLTTAGIRSHTDASGTADVHPDPTKTKEEVYPELNNKKQQANATRKVVSGQVVAENNIIGYVPTSVPLGSTNANRIITHGTDSTADPDAYIDNRPQNVKASGIVNTNDPVDGLNDDINDAIKQYNDSRYTPDYYPEPLPDNLPNPQYPTNPPVDTSGDSGDTPDPTTMVGVTASGMCSVYNPSKQELMNFSAWLWSPNFLDNFLKIFQNPMDAIIGLHIMYATPSTTTPSNIICGYLDSGVSAKVVNQQFTEIDCGTVDVPEYYGNAIDYEPYVQVHCYLPFVGIVSIKPNDVIGKKLNIKYGVDAMTGTCLAILTTKKGSSEIACYNFAGNCATQIPISGGSYAQMITGLAGFVASGIGAVATANPLMALGAGASLLNSHLDVGHSGAIGANAGAMGVRKPYLIITRKSAYEAAGYGAFYGYPANKTVMLGSCKGYTRIKSVHVEIPRATANEKSEIEQLLKQGVIIN